jgi:RNA polymerase sigma-70 factor (ECF subfamily)
VLDRATCDDLPDEEVVKRVCAGDTALYEILMRRHNRRLFRVAVSILQNDAEAEEVLQEAYVRAFEHLHQFAGEAKFSTWLTKIAVHEAMGRVRRRGGTENLGSIPDAGLRTNDALNADLRNPERQAYDHELRLVLERAIHALPETYRVVFVLRAVEGLTVAETAACLGIGMEAVKTRLHRGRALLRKDLQQRAGVVAAEAFPFHLSRCDRVSAAVLKRIGSVV